MQRQPEILLHVVEAYHQIAVIAQQQIVPAQPEFGGQRHQEQRAQRLQQPGFEPTQPPQIAQVQFLPEHVSRHVAPQLPAARRQIVREPSAEGDHRQEVQHHAVERQVEEVEGERPPEHRICPHGCNPGRDRSASAHITRQRPAFHCRQRDDQRGESQRQRDDPHIQRMVPQPFPGMPHPGRVREPQRREHDHPRAQARQVTVCRHAQPGGHLAHFAPPEIFDHPTADGAAEEQHDDQRDHHRGDSYLRVSAAAGKFDEGHGILSVQLIVIEGAYSSRKFTSMVAMTGTGLPSFMPGLKRHFSTASMAF